MANKTHFEKLINMYAAALVNKFYNPVMQVSEGGAIIEIGLSEKYHHSAGGVHGSVYFKMLDDAAFFCSKLIRRIFFCFNYFVYNLHYKTGVLRKNEGNRQGG